jgi:hypothetical protein
MFEMLFTSSGQVKKQLKPLPGYLLIESEVSRLHFLKKEEIIISAFYERYY